MGLKTARHRIREDLIRRLRHALAVRPPAEGEVKAVVLFGSLARGDFDGGSDVDLMVVGRRDGVDRTGFLGLGRHVDIMLVSPERFRRSTSPVVRAARDEGVRLWP